MDSAKEKLEAFKFYRIDDVQHTLNTDCVLNCHGPQLENAKGVLDLNKINISQFAASLKDLLIHDGGKNCNIILTGPANCGKTFLLKPVKSIFSDYIFKNPANDKYAWVVADKASAFLLNDCHRSKEIIPRYDLLLLLESETATIPASKIFITKTQILPLKLIFLQ